MSVAILELMLWHLIYDAKTITDHSARDNYENNTNPTKDWEKGCCHIDKQVSIHNNKERIKGVFKGINQDGSANLIINNRTEIVVSGIIQI